MAKREPELGELGVGCDALVAAALAGITRLLPRREVRLTTSE